MRAKDRESRELRDQLRAIQTSDGWAMLRTLGQVRDALAPRGTRRDRLTRSGIRGLRRLKKRVARLVQQAREGSGAAARGDAGPLRIEAAVRENHAVFCLPMIEWGFRFQRPQQLMRQFAQNGHLVLYAANQFHRRCRRARTRSIETNIVEITLPGDPAANIYQSLPAETDRAGWSRRWLGSASSWAWTMRSSSPSTRTGPRCRRRSASGSAGRSSTTAWTTTPGSCITASDILETESRLVAEADLVVASSALLFEGIRRRARASLLLRNACEYEHFSAGDRPAAGGPEAPRIGYYGAIAEWFDGQLVAELAGLRPGWRFELIGSTLAGDVRLLEDVPNIRLLGERPYDELPN